MSHPQVILVDMRTGSQCHHLQGHKSNVYSVQWSPFAEHLLATGGSDNKILLWDIRSAKGYLAALDQHNGEALTNQKDHISAHNGFVNGLCFSSDGLYLVSRGSDNEVRLWDVALAKNTLVNFGKVFSPYAKRMQIDMCYDGTTPIVFIPCHKKIEVFELFTGTKINSLRGHMVTVNCCVFRNQYHELYSAGSGRMILVWNSDISLTNLLEKKEIDPRFNDAWSDSD